MTVQTALQTLKESCRDFISNVENDHQVLIVGENVNVGSHISGLSSFLQDFDNPNMTVINMPNVESITAGICFGWNLNAGPSFIFIKQLDFLFLYFDDLVNTKNMFDRLNTPYNINLISFVVDTRLEGAQSSWRDIDKLSEFLSIEVYPISHVTSITEISAGLKKQGLKLFVISQKYGNQALDPEKRIQKVKFESGDAFKGFEVYSRDFDEHPWPMVVNREDNG